MRIIWLFILFVSASVSDSLPAQVKVDWNKFDFIPGDEILFEDELENERNGEFPGKWDLVRGSVAEGKAQNRRVEFVKF